MSATAPSPTTAPASGTKRSSITTEALAKSYGHRKVVDGLDLTFCAGEVVGLLGPNGAGKTTTFYMIVEIGRAHV